MTQLEICRSPIEGAGRLRGKQDEPSEKNLALRSPAVETRRHDRHTEGP
jgi:hypothetical protein